MGYSYCDTNCQRVPESATCPLQCMFISEMILDVAVTSFRTGLQAYFFKWQASSYIRKPAKQSLYNREFNIIYSYLHTTDLWPLIEGGNYYFHIHACALHNDSAIVTTGTSPYSVCGHE